MLDSLAGLVDMCMFVLSRRWQRVDGLTTTTRCDSSHHHAIIPSVISGRTELLRGEIN